MRVLKFDNWMSESNDQHPFDVSDINEAAVSTADKPCVGELMEAVSPHSGEKLKVTPCMMSALIKMGWSKDEE